MKKIATKLLKFLLVITLCFSNIFNSVTVSAMETIKNLMDSNNVEKVYSNEFISEDDANDARDAELLKQDSIKNSKKEEGISYLYYVSDLEKGTKTIPTTKEDFVETIINYSSEDEIKTEEELKLKEQELIDSYMELNDDNNIYHVTITSHNNPVKVGTKFNPVTYDTLEEAIKAVGNKNLTPIKTENEEDNQDILVDYDCATKTECENLEQDIRSNEDNINVNIEIKKNSSDPIIEDVKSNNFETKSFDSEEEAIEYANDLKEEILKYIAENELDTELQKVVVETVSLDNLDNILSSKTETIYQLTNVSGTYKSESAAKEAVKNYVNNLKNTDSNINVNESLKDENITITENKVDTVKVSTLFDTKEAAEAHFKNLQENELNYTLKNPSIKGIDQTTTSGSSSSSTGGTSTTNETWGHLDIDATNKINIMASDGKTIIDTVTGDITLSSVVVNGTKTVTYSEKGYDANRNAWEFMSTNRINLGVKSGDTVVIKGTITYTYNNKENTLSFTYTGKILTQNNTCQGWGHTKGYDLSVSTINVTTDNKVVVEVATKYELTYDKYNYTAKVNLATDKTTYTVTYPTITKTTTNYSYKLVGDYTTKGYDYVVEYPEDIMEDRYSFDAVISHKHKPATKDIDTYTYYVQTMEISDKGGDNNDNDDQILEQPPKTGNNINYISLIVAAILVIIKKIFN